MRHLAAARADSERARPRGRPRRHSTAPNAAADALAVAVAASQRIVLLLSSHRSAARRGAARAPAAGAVPAAPLMCALPQRMRLPLAPRALALLQYWLRAFLVHEIPLLGNARDQQAGASPPGPRPLEMRKARPRSASASAIARPCGTACAARPGSRSRGGQLQAASGAQLQLHRRHRSDTGSNQPSSGVSALKPGPAACS